MSERKPAKLRLLQGNAGHRMVPTEPVAPPEIPKPPGYLSAAARREWRHTAPLLKANGLIAMQDRELFARWCTLVAKISAYEKQLELETPTVTAQSGYSMPNPLIGIINAASKQLVGLGDRFGLNPKARAGQHVELKPELDEFDLYLARGKDFQHYPSKKVD